MKYLQNCWLAITADWSNMIEQDSVSGNCFQILWCGVISTLKVLGLLTLRLVMALLFPLTAVLIMYIDAKICSKIREDENTADRDL